MCSGGTTTSSSIVNDVVVEKSGRVKKFNASANAW
jgi:hypothetical protein